MTGASRGIGYACARALLERTDANIMLTGRDPERLCAAREALPPEQRERVLTRARDQANPRAVDALIAELSAPGLSVEGAILTVGENPLYEEGPRRLHALDAGTIETTVRTNCTELLRLSAALLGRFREQRSGVLIWIGSQAARYGIPGAALYGATKAFLSGLACAADHEYAGRGVRVHLLHPGVVRTPRTHDVADAFAARHGLVVAEAPDVARRVVDVFLTGTPAGVEQDI